MPVIRWHLVQWQYARSTCGADSSYLTAPQKQLPLRGEDGIIVEDMAISYKGQERGAQSISCAHGTVMQMITAPSP